jgi:hypothetical protein
LERLSTLRYSVRTILEIAQANKEGEGNNENKVKEITEEEVIPPVKNKGKGKAVDKSVKEWADRVKGLLYKLVNTVIKRL